jgi:hypothetical protein
MSLLTVALSVAGFDIGDSPQKILKKRHMTDVLHLPAGLTAMGAHESIQHGLRNISKALEDRVEAK